MNLQIFKDCVNYLGIEKPVEIKIKTCVGNGNSAECEAIFNNKGELKKTVITFWMESMTESGYDFDTIMVHELIHSYQWERGLITPNKKDHCKVFRRKARELKSVLEILHPQIKLGEIYSKTTDNH